MAIIGWLFLALIPSWLALLGIGVMIANNFGGKSNIWPILLFVASGALFYLWWGYKPFEIVVMGGAQ